MSACELCWINGTPSVRIEEGTVLRFSDRNLTVQADTDDVLDSDFPQLLYTLSVRASFGAVDTDAAFD
eukprot:3389362-Rhodomonas_salina.1